MKFSGMPLIALVLSLGAGGALAAENPSQNVATAKRPVHPRSIDCHPGYGMMEGGGYGYGMMGGYGHGMGGYGGMGAGRMLGPRTAIVWSLNLADEQRGKITKLIEKLQHDNWATMGTIMDDADVLRDLYHADTRDSVAIDQTYQKIFDLKRKMIKSALDTENEIESLLTPDQVKQLKDRLRQSPAPFPVQ